MRIIIILLVIFLVYLIVKSLFKKKAGRKIGFIPGIIEMEALIQKSSHRSGSEMRITSCMLETDFIT